MASVDQSLGAALGAVQEQQIVAGHQNETTSEDNQVKEEPEEDEEGEEASAASDAAPSVDVKENLYRCHLCDNYATIDRANLAAHLNGSHEVPFSCDECDYKTMRKAELEKHARSEHDEDDEDKKYFCDSCDYTATRADHLSNHVRRVHDRVRNYKCPECERGFFNRYQLDQHILSVHKNLKAFACPKCNYKSNRKDNLQAHIKLNHDESQVYTCTHCDFTCNRELHLRRHVKKNHKKKMVLACPQCTYTSHDRHNLNCHIKRTHEHLKPHQCHLCEYASFQRTHLTLHIKANHENIRDFLCNECGYKAARKDHLHKHIKFVHKKIKPFPCDQCNFAAAEKGTLNRHISAVHKKEKPFLCQYCGFSSTFKGNLKQHVQKLHEKYPCPIEWCKFRATSNELLAEHLNTTNHDKPKPKPRPPIPAPPPPPESQPEDTKIKAEKKPRVSKKRKYEEEIMGVNSGGGFDFPLDSIEPMQSMEVGNEPIAGPGVTPKLEEGQHQGQQQQRYNCFIPGCDFVGTTPAELEYHTNSFHFSGEFFEGDVAQPADYLEGGGYKDDDFDDLDDGGGNDDGVGTDDDNEDGDYCAEKDLKPLKRRKKNRRLRARAVDIKARKSNRYLTDPDSLDFLCNHCDFASQRSDLLLRHVKQSHNGRYPCPNCAKTFSTKSKMELHAGRSHRGMKLENLEQAGDGSDGEQSPRSLQPADANGDMQESHSILHSKLVSTPTDESPAVQSLSTEATVLPLGTEEKIGDEVPLSQCQAQPDEQLLPAGPKSLSGAKAVNGVDDPEEGQFLECAECSQYFLRRDRLELHAAQRHGPDSKNPPKGESKKVKGGCVCTYCGETLSKASKLRAHVNKEHETFACTRDGCTSRFASQEELDEHGDSVKHETIKKEPECAEDGASAAETNGVTPYRCRADDCTFQGVTKEEIVFHVRVNHAEMQEDVEEWYEEEELRMGKGAKRQRRRKNADGTGATFAIDGTFLCDRCEFRTSRKDHLRRHIQRVHDKLKPHECPKCDHKFFSKYHMQIHFKAIHENCKELTCPECDFKCNRKDQLNIHLRSKHNDGSVYMCTLCSFRGDTDWELERHMSSTHTELQTFQCTQCHWTFDRKDRYDEHMRREHENQQETECVICGFKAKDKSEYESHLRREHKRTGAIKCPECDYVAKRKDHLIKHIEFVHRKLKPFSCAQCQFTASQRGAINRHIQAVHRKEKPYLCQYCGFSASFKGNLKQHVQKVHEKVWFVVSKLFIVAIINSSHLITSLSVRVSRRWLSVPHSNSSRPRHTPGHSSRGGCGSEMRPMQHVLQQPR